VNYLMVSLMEEVLRSGTGAGVHSLGYNQPAAGKTGTSHDGWFAGFTSNLICIVWVGFDDYKQLDLEGARSALPIWAEFMKRAAEFRAYKDVKSFQPPSGVVSIQIDPETGMPATAQCPKKINEFFISGTEPVGSCPMHGGNNLDNTNVSGWDTSQPGSPARPPAGKSFNTPATIQPAAGQPRPPSDSFGEHTASTPSSAPAPAASPASAGQPEAPESAHPQEPKKKKGFFGRIFKRD
jgi:penicillin-binding protein 1B